MSSPNIFVGYRREDGAGWAGRLHADLRRELGPGSQIFMDVDGIPPGEDFRAYIDRAIGLCDAFIALIGPRWLDAYDEQGRRRLDDPHDFVRLELAAALNRNIRVIPVLVGGARLPVAEQLPEPLGRLVNRHAVSLDNETWESGVNKIVRSFVDPTDLPLARRTQPSVPGDFGTPAVTRNRQYRIIGAVILSVAVILAGLGATILVRYLDRSPAQTAALASPSVASPSSPATMSPTTTTPPPSETAGPPESAPTSPDRVVEDYYEAINARNTGPPGH